MKYLINAAVLTVFILVPLWSQVTEQEKEMSTGTRNALSVVIADVDAKQVEESWKSYLKKYGKTKQSKKELRTKDVTIPSIQSDGAMTIYAKITKGKKHTTLAVWFDLGNQFITSSGTPVLYANAAEFLQNFSNKARKDMVKSELKSEENELASLEKKLKKLQDDHLDYQKDIKKAEKKIEKAQKDMKENIAKQEKRQAEIEKQKQTVLEVMSRLKAFD
jgi:outer membrane translocation and assembly module TamA